MNNNNSRISIINTLEEFFQRRAGELGVLMAFLYGSWTSGLPRPDSDIDLALVFKDQNISEEEVFKRLNDIALSLSGVLLSEVNIIPIFTDFRKPMLYANAILQGRPVYINDFMRFIDLKNEAIHQMEDFGIFGREWQIEMTRKNLEALKNA